MSKPGEMAIANESLDIIPPRSKLLKVKNTHKIVMRMEFLGVGGTNEKAVFYI